MATKSSSTKSGFSDAEKAAMKERAKELKAEARAGDRRAKGEAAIREALAEMPDADRALAERIHEIVTTAAPQLFPKTWYGMPAWTTDDNKVVCFLKVASKFETRYATLGFEDAAAIDDGSMWPTSYAITKLTRDGERQVRELVTRAVGG